MNTLLYTVFYCALNCLTRFIPKITSTSSSSLTSFGEFPWMVALLDTNTGGFLCGGSLVEQSVVLTAAHCVNRKAPGSITVRLSVVTRPTASQMRQEIFPYHKQRTTTRREPPLTSLL